MSSSTEPRITVIQPDTWWEMSPTQRFALRKWMKENDLPAPLIPAQEPLTVENDVIHYTRIVLDDKDQPIYRNGEVTCEEITTPLKTPIPILPGTTFSS